jgi:hypothetical protein
VDQRRQHPAIGTRWRDYGQNCKFRAFLQHSIQRKAQENRKLQDWIPPEIMNSGQAGKASDIYSVGYIFFYVVSNGEKLVQIRARNSEHENKQLADKTKI